MIVFADYDIEIATNVGTLVYTALEGRGKTGVNAVDPVNCRIPK